MIKIAMNGLSKPGWLRKKIHPLGWPNWWSKHRVDSAKTQKRPFGPRFFPEYLGKLRWARCSRRFSRRWFLWENMGTWWFNHINVGRSWFHHQTLGIDSWVFLIYIIALQYSNLVDYHNSPTAWHRFFGGECPVKPELLLMSQCASPAKSHRFYPLVN